MPFVYLLSSKPSQSDKGSRIAEHVQEILGDGGLRTNLYLVWRPGHSLVLDHIMQSGDHVNRCPYFPA